jgi:hypothetical protein
MNHGCLKFAYLGHGVVQGITSKEDEAQQNVVLQPVCHSLCPDLAWLCLLSSLGHSSCRVNDAAPSPYSLYCGRSLISVLGQFEPRRRPRPGQQQQQPDRAREWRPSGYSRVCRGWASGPAESHTSLTPPFPRLAVLPPRCRGGEFSSDPLFCPGPVRFLGPCKRHYCEGD